MLYSRNSLHTPFAIRDKFFNLDFVLLFAVLLLGIISIFAQYSSSGGQWESHSINHTIRFIFFFLFFILISFINISLWNRFSFLIFLSFILLLLAVKFFGLQSQGSRRWINLFVFILQPSELMKIGIILFLANYYHRTSSSDVNKLRYLLVPVISIFIPFTMVVTQPDLGTALLILFSGTVVTWLAGVRWKIFAYLSCFTLNQDPIWSDSSWWICKQLNC